MQNTFFLALRVHALAICTLLGACSSGDTGPVLPSVQLDSIPPEVLESLPEIEDNELVPSNFSVALTFSELLDEDSVLDSVSLTSQNARDIYSGIVSITDVFPVGPRDERLPNIVISDRLVTQEVEVAGDAVDLEIRVSKVDVSAKPRLSLNAYYRLSFAETIKDLSVIESIHPVSGQPDTGNFVERSADIYFQTDDGAWDGVGTKFEVSDVNGSALGGFTPKFSATGNTKFALWRQTYGPVGGASIGLWGLNFDSTLELWGTDGSGGLQFVENIENMPSVDSSEPGVVFGDVIDLAVYGDEERVCAVWWQEAFDVLAYKRLYTRCAVNSVWGPKLLVRSMLSPLSLSKLAVTSLDSALMVSFVADDNLYLQAIPFFGTDLPMLKSALVIGGSNYKIVDYDLGAAFRSKSTLLITVNQTGLVDARRDYAVYAQTLSLAQDAIVLEGAVVISESNLPMKGVSQGYDYRGQGYAGWIVGTDPLAEFSLSRYDGVFWQTPFKMQRDGRGTISRSKVYVAEEGHAIFAWVQDLGVTQELRVSGSFAAPGSSYVIPEYQTILSSSSSLKKLDIDADNEGNAFVYGITGSEAFAIRFFDNAAWRNAWDRRKVLMSSSSIDSFELSPILKDGRFMAVFGAQGQSVQQVSAKLFTE
jgi:hypothetical protein